MKKILAIVLVIALVLVPVSALAANVSANAQATVTLSFVDGAGKTVKGGSVAYYDANGKAAPLASNTDVYAKVTAPSGYVLMYGSSSMEPADYEGEDVAYITAGKTAGMFGPISLVYDGTLTVTVEKANFSLNGAIITSATGAAVDGYGKVTVKGNTFTAANLNSYFNGEWYVATQRLGSAITAWTVLTNAAGRSASITLDADAVADYKEQNQKVYVAALVYPNVGVITGQVDTINKYGKVTVTWLSATSAKVVATANKGAKFIGWVYTGNLIAAENMINFDETDPVVYVRDLTKTDNAILTAHFILVNGGNFTTNTEETRTSGSDNPKTADNSNVALWTIVGIIALGGIALASKKVFAK